MNETDSRSTRQILVAIDTSPHGAAALQAAARMALELSAELQGLFVEDVELLQLAALPFVCEIDFASGVSRPLDAKTVETAMQTKAEGVRQAIAEAVGNTRLQWSFRKTRGKFTQTILTESLQADLVVVGWQKATSAFPESSRRGGPIVVIDTASPTSDHAIDAARRFAQWYDDSSVVVVTHESAEGLAARRDVSDCYVQRCSPSIESLLRAVRAWRPQLILVDRSDPLFSESMVDSLLAQFPCPLVLVQ